MKSILKLSEANKYSTKILKVDLQAKGPMSKDVLEGKEVTGKAQKQGRKILVRLFPAE